MRPFLIIAALIGASVVQAQPSGKTMVVRPPAATDDRDERREPRLATKMAPPASKPTTTPMMVVRPAPTSTTPPSKAEEMQRRQAEQRRRERGEQAMSPGSFHCAAYPVCDCRGLEQRYFAKSARFAHEQVARDCAALNRPDPCNCAAECSRVAQCEPI